jgi:dephospho-CoA kinase
MRICGLTGGIASGKSTVAKRLRELGVPVVDADAIAREVVEPGSAALAEIVAAFGATVLDAEGRLDRKALAARVFGDDEARARLEAIVHPRVAERTRERFAELEAGGERLAFYDVPLLVEKGLHEVFRPVVVVALPEDEQVRRAMERDGATEADVRARIAAQRPLADKIAVADHVIDNAGSIEATLAQVDALVAALRTTGG